MINFCLEVNIFANITGLVEPSKRISSSGIVVDKKVIKDRVNIDLDSGDDLGEEVQDHRDDTYGVINSGEAVEEDTQNELREGYGGLDGGDSGHVAHGILDDGGGIVKEEGCTRKILVERDGLLDSGDATGEELDN